jgi:hypothetical protein
MASPITQQLPKAGDMLRCDECGMEVRVVTDCESNDAPRLECCGQPLTRA